MEDPTKNKPEQLDIKLELATEKDWEAYRDMRISAITGASSKMFGPITVEEDKAKDEAGWKADLSTADKKVLLAWQGSEPIGIIILKDKKDGLWDIGGGYTAPESRGAVFARQAMAKILEEIRKSGGTKARIVTREGNNDIIKLSQLLGFKFVKVEHGWHFTEIDLK
jgi:ribosomal protein S18 acetylase RimI-like enzyme